MTNINRGKGGRFTMKKGQGDISFGRTAPSADSRDLHFSTDPSPRPAWMFDRSLLPKRPPTAPKAGSDR